MNMKRRRTSAQLILICYAHVGSIAILHAFGVMAAQANVFETYRVHVRLLRTTSIRLDGPYRVFLSFFGLPQGG
jgi:hypothetical protein